jgi:arylsulfatase A-like enzyme
MSPGCRSRVALSSAAIAALAALHTPVAQETGADEPVRPNFLFLVVDDLNDWVGVLGGHPDARTPNIDRLAERGVLFTNAQCPSPICIPSRTAVLTGVLPHRSGITGNGGFFRKLTPGVSTLPERLRSLGYRAFGAGKVFHHPDPQSWNAYFPSKGMQRIPQPKRPRTYTSVGGTKLGWGTVDPEDGAVPDEAFASWVSGALGREVEGPFFLACGFERPHLPWVVPAPWFEAIDREHVRLPSVLAADRDDLPFFASRAAPSITHDKVVKQGLWRDAVHAYLASVAFVDHQIGRILDALEAGPHAKNTVVILWSDHGMNLGEKEHWTKSALWEDTTRVPLIVAEPGNEGGFRRDGVVGSIDLYRTVVELAGGTVPEDVDGHSLVAMLRSADARRPEPVLTTIRGDHAVRSDRWRYIRYRNGDEELYDHAADPNEWTNLAGSAEHADVKAELARRIPR